MKNELDLYDRGQDQDQGHTYDEFLNGYSCIYIDYPTIKSFIF